MLPRNQPDRIRIVFDDHRLVANAGLLLPATLAWHLGLRELVDHHLDLGGAAGRANTGDKLMTLVASAMAGGDCIDDADVLRTGGTACTLGGTVKAPSTLGTFLRSFRWGHVRQLDRVSRELLARAWAAGAGPGDVLMSRLREGRANTARGAAHFLRETVGRVRYAGANGRLTLRADSGFYTHGVVSVCRKMDVRFSITIRQHKSLRNLIEAIPEDAWTPIPYWMDGAADVAETTCTPFQSEPNAAPVRLIVRRLKPTPGSQLALFATYSYHGFITDRDGEMLELEADHRRHAEIENAIRDLKHGVGLNHLPSGRFAANAAWLAVQVMAHNIARWTARIGLGSRPVKWCKSASSCCCCLGGCRLREIGLRKSFVEGQNGGCEVSTSDDPFVVLLSQDGANEAAHGRPVREDAHHIGASPDLLVETLLWVVGPELLPVGEWEAGEGQDVGSRFVQ